MKNARVLIVIVGVMAVVNFTSADIIQGINIDFVTIGNAGNAADTQVMATDGTTGYGAVSSDYRIGKYEVTNTQWNTFTAAAGAPTGNPSTAYNQTTEPPEYSRAQQPVTDVSWYETLQFCNYLTSGDKSKGAYLFSGNNVNPGDFLGINRAAAQTTYGTIYVLPTEDEWYKAAYFKPNGSGYSLYANGKDSEPSAGIDTNYDSLGPPWDIINGTQEQNGTKGMMGNVYEWNETLVGSERGLRGGCFLSPNYRLVSSYRFYFDPYIESHQIGFRVASVPEPCSLVLLLIGGLVLRRKCS